MAQQEKSSIGLKKPKKTRPGGGGKEDIMMTMETVKTVKGYEITRYAGTKGPFFVFAD